ncbi:MAG: hypothetical protein U1E53_26540 [Dongiaceae bacterium]
MRHLGPAGVVLASVLALGACSHENRNSDNRMSGSSTGPSSITYDYTGENRSDADARAQAYCSSQGLTPYMRGVQTDNGVHHATYDCR